MLISRKATVVVAVAASAALGLAACGGSSSSGGGGGSSTSPSASTAAARNLGAPAGNKGGTLKLVATGDISNYDTESIYDTNSASIARAYARQLYTYAASNTASDRLPVVPDLADGMPTVSSDGLTYTIKIKQGADWDINGTGRQVTAQDAIRGIKMTCNPVLPFGAAYLSASIKGLATFCTNFGKVSQTSAPAIKSFEEGTPVAGLTAVDATTLKITLVKPASDFMHFIALTAASPVNIEQLQYVPDSTPFRQHVYSDGPYMISSYTPNKTLTLVRNPVWNASTDSVRKAYVDNIDVTYGVSQAGEGQQIQAGSADATVGADPITTTLVNQLKSANSPLLHINPTGGTNPYIVFNLINGGPVKNLLVRQAINYAVNKRAISQLVGGSSIAPPINQIFSQSVVGAGWKQQDLYPSPNDSGDPAMAKKLLAQAGYPNGVTIKYSYRTEGNYPEEADSLKTSLALAGIKLVLKAVPNENFFSLYLQKPGIAQSGDWQMSTPDWFPDWEGSSERSYFTPLFDGRAYGPGSTNYGDFNNAAVNTLADKALTAADQTTAAADWNQVDKLIMQQAPWVPIVEQNQVNIVSSRTKGFAYNYPSNGPDITDLTVQ